jgi:hypothetical protein
MITFPLTAETLQAVVRAGLPHAALGMNISKLAADAAVITINADGTATVGIPPAGLSLGAKGGGKRGPRAKKTIVLDDAFEAARLEAEPTRVALPRVLCSEDTSV